MGEFICQNQWQGACSVPAPALGTRGQDELGRLLSQRQQGAGGNPRKQAGAARLTRGSEGSCLEHQVKASSNLSCDPQVNPPCPYALGWGAGRGGQVGKAVLWQLWCPKHKHSGEGQGLSSQAVQPTEGRGEAA